MQKEQEQKREQAQLNSEDVGNVFCQTFGLAKNNTKIFKNNKKGYYHSLLGNYEAVAKRKNNEIKNKTEKTKTNTKFFWCVFTKQTHKVMKFINKLGISNKIV